MLFLEYFLCSYMLAVVVWVDVFVLRCWGLVFVRFLWVFSRRFVIGFLGCRESRLVGGDSGTSVFRVFF